MRPPQALKKIHKHTDMQERINQEIQDFPTAKLSVEHVYKDFKTKRGTVRALEDASLTINEGEFVCFVGPSGCGKSTLLNIIAGLEKPDRGKALIDGEPILGPGRDRMMMFQEHALFPWLDVIGNVMFGLKQKPNLNNKERLEVAKYYLYLVKMDKFAHASIHELSGGMRQRVALARSLAPNPKILLMDEPFSALDAMTREQLYGDIQDIWAKRKKTIVFVTHNVRESVCLGNRVILFSPHPGRVRKEFTIDLPRPRNINSHDLADIAREITAELKGYQNAAESD